MLEILLGRVAEAIYFSLFMILVKRLKEKRLLYTILMIAEYLILYACFPYNVRFQILYTFISYIILKILYKDKAQITDIFTFTIGSIILTISCIILYFIISVTFKNVVIYAIINRIIIFLFLYLTRNKLYKIQNIYKKNWNRNDGIKKNIKSTTFRAVNLVVFNIIFYVLNICMIFIIIKNGGA